MSDEERATQPVVAAKEPFEMDVEPMRYSWCRCGFSEHQPICDNAHRVHSTLKSLKIHFDKPQTVFFCQCKQTKNPPFCDGTHNTLP